MNATKQRDRKMVYFYVRPFTQNRVFDPQNATLARCRELRELSDRLTNDGRDALAALQMELEAEEEARLAEEMGKLRDAMACELPAAFPFLFPLLLCSLSFSKPVCLVHSRVCGS